MKSVGVIVEYNPFHNGHAFHIAQSKKAANAEIVIAAMSGNFLQRGEPALVSKWTRSQMALMAGVDLVFELPFQFATQQAEIFANGGVSILSEAGCDAICFGSEDGNINAFEQANLTLQTNETVFNERVKEYISEGVSYPKALSLAFGTLTSEKNTVDMSKPNNILGFYYVKAAQNQRNRPNMLTISRQNADYHDEHFGSDSIASATSIRSSLFSNNQELDQIKPYLPHSSLASLLEYKKVYGGFHHWEQYWPYLKYKLLQSNPEELRTLHGVEEGIENRLLSNVLKAESFVDFINRVKTKRYTWTRLQRMCLHILTNSKKVEMQLTSDRAPYLRLLGMTEKGRSYLNKNKQHFNIPLISKLSSYKGTEIDLDIRTSRIYALGVKNYSQELLIQEFNQKPIYIEK